MTRKRITVRALAGVVFSLLAFAPNNLVRLTPVAFAQDRNALFTQASWGTQEGIPANQVVWRHVGKIYLNPNTGKAVYVGTSSTSTELPARCSTGRQARPPLTSPSARMC